MAADFDLPVVGNGSGLDADEKFFREELQLAFRNKAMPLEGLRYYRTPTGMHYTLTHFDIPEVDPREWRLSVGGWVGNPLLLSLEELQQRPSSGIAVTLECAGDGRALLQPRPLGQPWFTGAVGTAVWEGTPLTTLLEEAQMDAEVQDIVFTGLDRGIEGGILQSYQRGLTVEDARRPEVLLAWSMNGAPLEPQHGFPLRLIVPGWYGMTSVKWLRSIECSGQPFEGYQQTTAYRYSQSREEPGEPVTRMRVRSLMIPPGVPDFLTRMRIVAPGLVDIRGKAWSGYGRIVRMEFSADGGASWAPAELGEPMSEYAWQSWRYPWEATPGRYELCCRAYDESGEAQPLEQHWTARGMGNNTVHRVPVIVQ